MYQIFGPHQSSVPGVDRDGQVCLRGTKLKAWAKLLSLSTKQSQSRYVPYINYYAISPQFKSLGIIRLRTCFS